MDQNRAVLAHVTGRVQGVSFRIWVKRQAEALGLAGWVRNEADGSVRAVIAGRADTVDVMIERLHQGPPAATVSAVEVEETVAPASEGFRIVG